METMLIDFKVRGDKTHYFYRQISGDESYYTLVTHDNNGWVSTWGSFNGMKVDNEFESI